MDIAAEQVAVCAKYGATLMPVPPESKVGIAQNARQGHLPLNGLRLGTEGGTCGWYIWGGEEFSEAADFFAPMHATHLVEECPRVLKYLGLPPGWRFLIADGYEDVWFDPSLLKS